MTSTLWPYIYFLWKCKPNLTNSILIFCLDFITVQMWETHLASVFGARSTLAVAGCLLGRNHSYLLYWHAAVTRQRSDVTPTAFLAHCLFLSPDPRPRVWSAVPSTTCFQREEMVLRDYSPLSVQFGSSSGAEMKRDQVTVVTGRQLWRWWGVRSSWRFGNYSTVHTTSSSSSSSSYALLLRERDGERKCWDGAEQ